MDLGDTINDMTAELLETITNNFINGNGSECLRLITKYSNNKREAMENVLNVYEYLRGNCGQNMATRFSVFVRT